VTVEIRLLGEVEVRIDGRVVDVGHARQQCVLASLAVEPNRPAPPDQLLDRVWGTRPPQRARGTLHSYVSRLRKALADAPSVGLDLRTGGYILSTDPLAVDIGRFRNLVATATRTPDDDQRAAMLTQALALWRGDAFGMLDTPWLDSVREELHAERLAAELERNDVELRLGRHAQLVASLARSAAAHLWDERLAGQHMLALYRCGRQAEALEAYQRFRQRLADELGADPSPPLQLLYHEILTTDPALTAPPPRRSPVNGNPLVPRQLPAPSPSFVGRAKELRDLDRAVGSAPIVVVAAGGGMGKTWLTLQWSNRNAFRFPDGQLYANLRGFDPTGEPVEAAAVVRAFLSALGVEPARVPVDDDAQAGLYRSMVAGKRMLIVLDNVRDTAAAAPLLPGTQGSTVLITSRRRPTGLVVSHGARVLSLDVLPPDDARRVLLGGLGRSLSAAEHGAATELLEHCSGLPLALGIAAARAAIRPELPLSALAAEVRAASAPLDAFDTGELAVNLRAVLAASVDALSAAASNAFALLGLAPGADIGVDAVASLSALPVPRARTVLAELAAAHLVVEQAPGRFRMHDLVRLYAVELTPSGASDAERRLLDHYLHTAHAAALLLSPHREPLALTPAAPGAVVTALADLEQAMAWFDAEQTVLMATIRHAGESGLDAYACALPWTLATYYDRRGHWQDWVAAQQIAVEAAGRLGDWSAQAQAHRLLANAYSNLRTYDDALSHLHQALALFDEHDHDAGRAHTQFDVALLYDRQSRPADALRHAVLSLRFYRATGNQLGEAVALNAVGWYHCELGEYAEAIENCRAALDLTRAAGSAYGQANTWDSLGYAHHHLTEYPAAIECYEQAIGLFRDIGDSHAEALTLDHLGDSWAAAGERAKALDAWRTALDLLDVLNHPEADQLRRKLVDA
jgi:DNA-binding SARP family transcriptional activator